MKLLEADKLGFCPIDSVKLSGGRCACKNNQKGGSGQSGKLRNLQEFI